ncbi:hypothetical protein GQ44DRAFT_727505 [Phaeosphaeriaceae sp. PMI808]|nr:hypothetical protein GQ44DRAFT_727505 [Phaeosphaeriaceae sp. PMI808]
MWTCSSLKQLQGNVKKLLKCATQALRHDRIDQRLSAGYNWRNCQGPATDLTWPGAIDRCIVAEIHRSSPAHPAHSAKFCQTKRGLDLTKGSESRNQTEALEELTDQKYSPVSASSKLKPVVNSEIAIASNSDIGTNNSTRLVTRYYVKKAFPREKINQTHGHEYEQVAVLLQDAGAQPLVMVGKSVSFNAIGND